MSRPQDLPPGAPDMHGIQQDAAQPTPAQRLAHSRERMRQVMKASQPQPRHADDRPAGELPKWLQGLTDMPVVAAALDAVRSWWAHHPLRLATLVATDAGKTVIQPLAQRHPLALVAGAVVVGGVIVWLRPWRRIVKPALFVGLMPQVMSKVLAHVPVESWLSVLTSFTESVKPRRDVDEPQAARSNEATPEAPAKAASPAPTPPTTPAAKAPEGSGGETLH